MADFCIRTNTKFIYIAGIGGSGKSTLAKNLKSHFENSSFTVNLINADEFVTNTDIRRSAKTTFVDSVGQEWISNYTTSFEESYFLQNLKGIIYSLKQGLDCYFVPKKANSEDEYILLNSNADFTIVEGVATTFLEKEKNSVLLFIDCDIEIEINRRIMRARNNDDTKDKQNLLEECQNRRRQLNAENLRNLYKFDLILESLKSFDFNVKKDTFNAMGENMNKDLDFLIKTIKQASRLLLPNFEIMDKDTKGDIVTSLDLSIEKFIIEKVKQEYPLFEIISEEFHPESELSKNCFVINGIDGTINLSKKMPIFGMQFAIVRDYKTTASVVYLPILNELYYADESNAYLNGERIFVKSYPIEKVLISSTGTKKIDKIKLHEEILRDYGSIAVSFVWVAAGRLSGAIYKGNKIWNYLPVMHICEKAGAKNISKQNLRIAAADDEILKLLLDAK